MKMANPLLSLNENFSYNSMLARALLQITPAKERDIIKSWLQVLHEMNSDAAEMNIRNEYMWFLLLQLQNKNITEPFKHTPPSHRLRPLRDILPSHIYEEVLTTTEQNMSWMERAGEKALSEEEMQKSGLGESGKSAPFSSHPAEFMANQPLPANGIICYLAAFGDQNY